MTKTITGLPPDAAVSTAGGGLPASAEAQQQWRLLLERAFLSLQRAGAGGIAGAGAEASARAVERDPHPAPPASAAVTGDARANRAAPAPGEQTAGLRASTSAAATASPPVAPARPASADAPAAPSSGRAGMPPLVGRDAGPTRSSAAPAPAAAQRALARLPELQSANLLRGEQGLHLVIRDPRIADAGKLIQRVRRVFAELSLTLVRITLNGRVAWRAPAADTGGEAAPAAVNRIY